ncbi:MAG: NUDIX domain-containing protein [Dehalococcoidia bacterium]|nr:NUDIX domain-containing protein [Dehalococcoidia bacterium]
MTSEKVFPVLISSRDVYAGRVIKLRVDEIEVKPGLNVRREVIEHPGAVVIVPVDDEGRVLWIRQHRYAAGRELLELPAGTLEPDEAPEATARRELVEETGFAAAEWQRLGGFYSAPGFCGEYLHAYLAMALTPESADGDEDEDITLEPLSVEESLARIDAGEVEDAKSLASILLFLRHR